MQIMAKVGGDRGEIVVAAAFDRRSFPIIHQVLPPLTVLGNDCASKPARLT